MASNKEEEEEHPENSSKLSVYPLNPLNSEEAGSRTAGEWRNTGEEAEKLVESNQKEENELLTPELVENILGPEKDTQCGLGVLRGECLQPLANPLTYLLLSSLVALIQGIFYTYANATLSTVEKRFHLPSKISGLVTTGNDLVQLVLAVPLTFVAGRGHRPRWLALGMSGAVVACVLAAIPHFLFGAGQARETEGRNDTQPHTHGNMLCGGEDNRTECGEVDTTYSVEQYTVITLHLIAQMLAGLASLLYYSIGYTYLDEAVSKSKIPFFLGYRVRKCADTGSCVWVFLGCVVSLIVGLPSHTPTTLHPRHPHWIGAWWIGYLIIGSCLLVVSWSLALLPKTLPGTRQRALRDLTQAAQRGGAKALHTLAATLRPAHTKGYQGIVDSLRRLLSNRVFLLVSLNQAFFWFAFFGYITFKPKFLEHQFKMSAAKANQYIAGAALAATLAGWLMTGAGLTLLRPKAKHVLSFMVLLSFINTVLHFCMVNISCDHDVIHGMDLVLQERAQPYNTTHFETAGVVGKGEECSAGCRCSGRFSPVCVGGSLNFYSGCHAGCSSVTRINGTRIYENCTCTPLGNSTQWSSSVESFADVDSSEGRWSAVEGYCSHDCPTFYMYLTLTVLTKMTHAASRVPLNIILFRCVEERDKDLGLGVFNAVLALAASIPAPIIFGWAIDHSCRLWEERCGEQGFCWLYDVDSFRRILHGLPAGLMLCCLITEIILLTMHKAIHLYGEAGENTVSCSTSPTLKTFPQSSTKSSLVTKEDKR